MEAGEITQEDGTPPGTQLESGQLDDDDDDSDDEVQITIGELKTGASIE